MSLWRYKDLYERRPIPLGEKSNELSMAMVHMDCVVHGPGYPLAVQHPCARDQNIQFVEEGHKYTVTHEGREVPSISVTTFAHGMFPHFPGDLKARKKVLGKPYLPRYEYYERMVDFLGEYVWRHVHGHSSFSAARAEQWDAFCKEIAHEPVPRPEALLLPAPGLVLTQLHTDTRLPRPANHGEYTKEMVRTLVDVWIRSARVVKHVWSTDLLTLVLRFLWFCNGGVASTLGTYMHENIEFKYNGEPHETWSREWRLFKRFEDAVIKPQGLVPYRTEWKVYDSELRLVGTIDMTYWDGTDSSKIWIYDWKRAKRLLEKEDITWETQYGTCPVTAKLEDCNYHSYSMQLNIYKTILERNYGVTVQGMFLVVLHPAQREYICRAVYEHPTLCAELVAHRKQQIAAEDAMDGTVEEGKQEEGAIEGAAKEEGGGETVTMDMDD